MADTFKDTMDMLKSILPKDIKSASAEELTDVLKNIKNYAADLSKEIEENTVGEEAGKYKDGLNALDDLIDNGVDNPDSDIDTSKLDEYITTAKNNKSVKKLEKKVEKELD